MGAIRVARRAGNQDAKRETAISMKADEKAAIQATSVVSLK